MDDEPVGLSDATMAALQDFLQEQQRAAAASEGDPFAENWAMSQFWYDDETSGTMAAEVAAVCPPGGRVACVACPSLFRRMSQDHAGVSAQLFEFDMRFAALGDGFTFYDYNEPAAIPQGLLGAFSVVVADPPYLAEECLEKTMETMQLLSGPGATHYLLTGAVMRRAAWRGLQLRPAVFRPQHRNKLGNEFLLYCRYSGDLAEVGPTARLGGWDAELDSTSEDEQAATAAAATATAAADHSAAAAAAAAQTSAAAAAAAAGDSAASEALSHNNN